MISPPGSRTLSQRSPGNKSDPIPVGIGGMEFEWGNGGNENSFQKEERGLTVSLNFG